MVVEDMESMVGLCSSLGMGISVGLGYGLAGVRLWLCTWRGVMIGGCSRGVDCRIMGVVVLVCIVISLWIAQCHRYH